jgi:hypothetical protein
MNLAYKYNSTLSPEKEPKVPLKLQLSLYSLSAPEVQGKVWNFLQSVEKITKRIPMIYSGYYYWLQWMTPNSGWLKYLFWLAWYANESVIKVPPPWKKWTFWQFSGNGNGPQYGSQGLSLDMDYFNGTLDDLKVFANVVIPPVPTPILPTPTPTPQPTIVDYITTVTINIRSVPIVNPANFVRYAWMGETLHIKFPLIRENGYLQLTDGNWASEQYIKPVSPIPAPTPPSGNMYYATVNMNVRSSPDASSDSNKIGIILKDTQVYVDDVTNPFWVHIAPFNLFPNGGWCSKTYMKPLEKK